MGTQLLNQYSTPGTLITTTNSRDLFIYLFFPPVLFVLLCFADLSLISTLSRLERSLYCYSHLRTRKQNEKAPCCTSRHGENFPIPVKYWKVFIRLWGCGMPITADIWEQTCLPPSERTPVRMNRFGVSGNSLDNLQVSFHPSLCDLHALSSLESSSGFITQLTSLRAFLETPVPCTKQTLGEPHLQLLTLRLHLKSCKDEI